jgi:hypothetical protein
MPIKTNFQSPRFQSFHSIAASRGDGLHPELVKLFERLAKGADANISEAVGTSVLPNDFTAKNVAPDSKSTQEALKLQR